MKKTLSLVLALVFVAAAFASFALTVDTSTNNPFKLASIKVTDAAGYANPYAAIDNANAFVENQAAYVVVEYNLISKDDNTYKDINEVDATPYETAITSSTLDLTYAEATKKYQIKYFDGSISATYGSAAGFAGSGVFAGFDYDSAKVQLNATLDISKLRASKIDSEAYYNGIAKGKAERYLLSFIGVTRAATMGEVKAAMKVAGTKFADYTADLGADAWPDGAAGKKYLVAYDSMGNAKYTIFQLNGDKGTYRVFAGKATKRTDPHIYLFDYVQDGNIFNYIGYTATPGDLANTAGAAAPVGFTYDGKLVYLGADNKLGTADDKDLTSAVNEANAFFGFTFSTSNPAAAKNFEAKTAGNPIVVTDTYAYVTAPVIAPDEDVEIAPTGDFSANIAIVLISSALLAAATLAFVAKKARD